MRLFVCKYKLQNQCTLVTHERNDLSCGQFNKETTKYVLYKSDPCFDKCTHIWFNTNLLMYTSFRYNPPTYNGVIQVELHMCILQLQKRTCRFFIELSPGWETQHVATQSRTQSLFELLTAHAREHTRVWVRDWLQRSELIARAALCLPLRKMPSSWINQFHALFHYNFRILNAHWTL